MYISVMSERESVGLGWKDVSSSEPREEIVLRLLMLLMLLILLILLRLLRLDIEERPESSDLMLLAGAMKGSMDTSCRYLESRARLKERSTSSNSSSSRRRRGRRIGGMSTNNTTDDEHEVPVDGQKWVETQKLLEMPTPC